MTKKPELDEPTLRLMGALVRMKPKPHEDMKVGKRKSPAKKPLGKRNKRKDAHRGKD